MARHDCVLLVLDLVVRSVGEYANAAMPRRLVVSVVRVGEVAINKAREAKVMSSPSPAKFRDW